VAERLERSANPHQSFGTWLRSQREHRDVSLREIADETRISMRYLQALEEDRFDILPAPVFARGFLREYARFVGLDADEVVTFYMSAIGKAASEDPADDPVVTKVAASPWSSVILLIAAIAALLVLVGLFSFLAKQKERSELAAPPVSLAPVPAASPVLPPAVVGDTEPAAPEEPPPAPIVVTVELIERCWVEVKVDGVQRISENYVAGESLELEAESEVLLTLGNPLAARVEVNGKPLPVDARPGRVLRDLRIDLATVGALSAEAVEPPSP
jgi:transcriptional regulator with XRE-family HTH domain